MACVLSDIPGHRRGAAGKIRRRHHLRTAFRMSEHHDVRKLLPHVCDVRYREFFVHLATAAPTYHLKIGRTARLVTDNTCVAIYAWKNYVLSSFAGYVASE